MLLKTNLESDQKFETYRFIFKIEFESFPPSCDLQNSLQLLLRIGRMYKTFRPPHNHVTP